MSRNPLFPKGNSSGLFQGNPHNQVTSQQNGQVASQPNFGLSQQRLQQFIHQRAHNSQAQARVSSMEYMPNEGKVRPASEVADSQQTAKPPSTRGVNGYPNAMASLEGLNSYGQQNQNTQWIPNTSPGNYADDYRQQTVAQTPYCPQGQPQAPTQYMNVKADSSTHGLDDDHDGQVQGETRPLGTQQVHPGSAFMPVTATGSHHGPSSGNNSQVNRSMMPQATSQPSTARNPGLPEARKRFQALRNKLESRGLSATEARHLRTLASYLRQVSASSKSGGEQGEATRAATPASHHGSSPIGGPSNSAGPQRPLEPAQPKSNNNTFAVNIAQAQSRFDELCKKLNAGGSLTDAELAEGSRLTTILEEFQAKQMQVTGQVGEIAPTSNSLQNNPLPNTNPAQHANQQTPSTLPQNIQNQEAYQTSMYRAKMRWDDLWKKNETETLTLAEQREVARLRIQLGNNGLLPRTPAQQASGAQAVQNGSRAAPSQAGQHRAHAPEQRNPNTAALPHNSQSVDGVDDDDDELVCLGQIPRATQPPQNHDQMVAPPPNTGISIPKRASGQLQQILGATHDPCDLLALQNSTHRRPGRHGVPQQSSDQRSNMADVTTLNEPQSNQHIAQIQKSRENTQTVRPVPSLQQRLENRRLDQGVQQQRNGNNIPQAGAGQTRQANKMPPVDQSKGQGKVHLPENIQNSVSSSQQLSASMAPLTAGQKRCLDPTDIDNGRDSDHPTKKARKSASPRFEPQQNREDRITAQTSSTENNAVGPIVTLPIGNLDPALAMQLLKGVIATYQAGGKVQPVYPGKDTVVMPARSVSVVQPQGSPHTFVGRSDNKDLRQWDKIATPSFHEALRVAKDHERLVQADVPLENVKIAVFDDRQMKVVPMSEVENKSQEIESSEGASQAAKSAGVDEKGYNAGTRDTFSLHQPPNDSTHEDVASAADPPKVSSSTPAVTTVQAANSASNIESVGESPFFQASATQSTLKPGVTSANSPQSSLSEAAATISLQTANEASKSESPEEKHSCQAPTAQSSPKSGFKAPSPSPEESKNSMASASQTNNEPQTLVPCAPTFKEAQEKTAAEREAEHVARIKKVIEQHNKDVEDGLIDGTFPPPEYVPPRFDEDIDFDKILREREGIESEDEDEEI